MAIDRGAWARRETRSLLDLGVPFDDAAKAVAWLLRVVPQDEDPDTYIIPDAVWDAEAVVTDEDIADARADWYARRDNGPEWKGILDAVAEETPVAEYGTSSSGNWGHAGVKGQLGGSAPGGGFGALGVAADASTEDKTEAVADRRAEVAGQKQEQGEAEETQEWQPSMSREQADAWASDSAIKTPLYHATTAEAAEDIRNEGFRLDVGAKNGRVLGDGVYLGDADTAKAFARQGGQTLELRVRVHNVATYEQIDNGAALPKEFRGAPRPARYMPDDKGQTPDSNWDWVSRLAREHFPDRRRSEGVAAVLQAMGIEAVSSTEQHVGTVVFNPRNIVVVKS